MAGERSVHLAAGRQQWPTDCFFPPFEVGHFVIKCVNICPKYYNKDDTGRYSAVQ